MAEEYRFLHPDRARRIPVLLFDLVFLIFAGFAIHHSFTKPGLPGELTLAYPVLVDGVRVADPDEAEFLLSTHSIGDSVIVGSAEGGRDRSTVAIAPYHALPETILDTVAGLMLPTPGVLVYLSRKGDRPALLFPLAVTTLAAALLGTKTLYTIHPAWIGRILCMLFFLSYTAVPVLFLHFTLVFPAIRWKRYGASLPGFYALAILLGIWGGATYLRAAETRTIEGFHEALRISMIMNGAVFILLLAGVGNFILSYRRSSENSEKKKIRWILYGLTIGTAPFIFLWVLPYAFGALPLVPEYVFKLFLLLIPVTFAISIAKYQAMDVDVVINRSAVYAIILGALLSLYAVLVGSAAMLIGGPPGAGAPWISAGAAILIALLFNPLRTRAQRFVDRAFFRVQYNYRTALRRFLDEMKESGDAEEMSALIIRRVNELLPVERIGFFIVQEGTQRTQLLAHEGFDLLEKHGLRFQGEKLKSDLHLPVALDDLIEPGQPYESADGDVFRRWGMALVFPMMTDAGELLGFLVLGAKKSQGRFTAEDVDLLTTVTLQAGLSIQRITLRQKLFLERESAQRLRELNQLKSYFVSSVSHDLKTPLTSIRMYAELLRTNKRLPAARVEEYLAIIEGESERLSRLIGNVLDFARVERGIKEYHCSEVAIDELVENVLHTLEYQLRIGGFSVQSRLCAGNAVLFADRDALTEALINVLSNAMKYSGERKEIVVSTFRKDGLAGVQVKDHGIGIAAGELGHIFEPFYRAGGGKMSGAGGTGLGLALVKHIVEAHGGHVDVVSAPGAGSEFTLYIPLKEDSSEGGDP